MFSNINEAWNNDPVKEISDKLSNGYFSDVNISDTFKINLNKNSLNPIQVSGIAENAEYPLKRQVNQKSKQNNDIISLTDNNSISLSEYTDNSSEPDYFDKTRQRNHIRKKQELNNHPQKRRQEIVHTYTDDSDTINSVNTSDFFNESKCNHSMKHFKNCNRCCDKIKKLVNIQVNEKLDEIILDNKLKQLQTMPIQAMPLQQTTGNINCPASKDNSVTSDLWKNVLIITIGIIVVLILIFLIVKTIYK